jgi:serine/threonine-protein kinase HipA
MKPVPVIEVRIWGDLVGAIAPDPRLGVYAFAYAPAWKRKGIELAPLQMPLSAGEGVFAFQNLPSETYHGLPAIFADALPDAFGNALIDAWMATKGISKESITILDRLAYMGKRGMGALEFKPARGASKESSTPLKMKTLVEQARLFLHGTFAEDRETQAALANIIRVGTSAGGARAKAVIAWNPESQEVCSGQFDTAPGFEHWLLKFDGVGPDSELGTGKDYGRIEYAYSKMAAAAGIEMAECRLLEENGRAHFMTKRFDRDSIGDVTVKHHMQSLCAMSHLDYKQRATHSYSQLFMTIARLGLGDDAMRQAFLRMAFNVMSRNCDDHTKNFAFLMRRGQSWSLAPAYDVTHAYNPKGEWTFQHLMSVNGKFTDMMRKDLLAEADRFMVRKPESLLLDLRAALSSWPQFAKEAGLSPKQMDEVSNDFRAL